VMTSKAETQPKRFSSPRGISSHLHGLDTRFPESFIT
jgi:hypothetical protein